MREKVALRASKEQFQEEIDSSSEQSSSSNPGEGGSIQLYSSSSEEEDCDSEEDADEEDEGGSDENEDEDEDDDEEEGSYEDDEGEDDGSESDEEEEEEEEEGDEDGEEEQWSLRVRLLSAVDLPPSLSPTVPLCPWFKFGLVDDIHNFSVDNNGTNGKDSKIKGTEEQQNRKKRILTPQNQSDDEEDEDYDDGENDDGEESGNNNEGLMPRYQMPQTPSHKKHLDRPPKPPKSQYTTSTTTSSSSLNNANNKSNTLTTHQILSSLPPSQTRTSTSKLMLPSRLNNSSSSSGADWNEEYRWDDLASPMESALVVRLCTRLGPDGGTASGNRNAGSGGHSGGEDGIVGLGSSLHGNHGIAHQHFNNPNNNPHHNNPLGTSLHGVPSTDGDETNELSQIGAGIKGLWRKGRQQLEEHRRLRANQMASAAAGGEHSREEKAATVAQFLMRQQSNVVGGDDSATVATTVSNSTTGTNTAASLFGQKDLVDYQQKWSEQKRKEGGSGGGDCNDMDGNSLLERNAHDGGDHHDDHNDDENELPISEGLCLGTLTIPLSRLPLEDAFCGNSAAVVERWYQLDDPNPVSSSHVAGSGSHGDPSPLSPASSAGEGYPPPSPGLLPHGPKRCPSVLIEITFASKDYLDEFEEEIHGGEENSLKGYDFNFQGDNMGGPDVKVEEAKGHSSSPHDMADASSGAKSELPVEPKKESKKKKKHERPKPEEPELDPGIVDFLCIAGARDIGNQRNDDGSKGWVESTPECCVLERFPPDDEFHVKNGRNTALIPQVEWFCFPEGCKLWRGSHPPTHEDLKAGGVSSTTRSLLDASFTAFDTYLGSSSSFSWFVLSSNSDDYGSKLVKTYGAVVRFYVPAPKGIDPTQDDFAQTIGGFGAVQKGKHHSLNQKRLWVPIGICLTSTLPIVGVVEEILLRMCDALSSKLSSNKLLSSASSSVASKLYNMLQTDLFHLIVNFSTPIPGVVHCSIPFLEGERLHITTSPPNGLPPLPHGGAVALACRLLGAEGLTLLLAAALTECKVLIHSTNVANVAMVAEVISALLFPFTWQLPYIPVLPKDMLEFLEAPLSFFVGIPTANLKFVDKNVLSEIVVVDLDDVASSTDYEGRRGPRTKIPSALPASVSTSISKALYRLLREEDALEAQMQASIFPGCRRSPRLENESLPERKFRIHVAIQICSLVRGYQDCLFFVSASQPVFNRDRFLRLAPALFEEKRPSVLPDGISHFAERSQKILSPRSKRFLSLLVNSQHFHQLLERLSSEETAFFHEVMESIEAEEDSATGTKSYFSINFGSVACEEATEKLFSSLEAIENEIPTYRVDRERRIYQPGVVHNWELDDEEFKLDYDLEISNIYLFDSNEKTATPPFTHSMLLPIMVDKNNESGLSAGEAGVHALSLEYLVELEKNPWRYSNILEMPNTGSISDGEADIGQSKDAELQTRIQQRTKLREAIGEIRFRAWKIANDHKDEDDVVPDTPVIEKSDFDKAFDLSSILSSVPELPLESSSAARGFETQPKVDANDRNKVRNVLELAFGSAETNFEENGRDLISEAEIALRNPSAQRYLFSVLSQRSRIENQRRKKSGEDSKLRVSNQQSVSRLEPNAFDCIVRLCYAVLQACMEEQNYESAYRLLTYTGGFCTAASSNNSQVDQKTMYMTAKVKTHPIFGDMRLWERVLLLHQQDQQNDRKEDTSGTDQNADETESAANGSDTEEGDSDAYDAAVTTLYEMVGYNVLAEDVARFATQVSQDQGWFTSEKGQSLLVLARRLTAKRDEGDDEKPGMGSDLALGGSGLGTARDFTGLGIAMASADLSLNSQEIAWSHPSTSLITTERHGLAEAKAFLGNMLGGSQEARNVGVHNFSNKTQAFQTSISADGVLDAKNHSGRVAIAAMASFGSTAVVTGGVDGSIFLAHTIHFESERDGSDSNHVDGIFLQWGTKGDENRESGSGAISCLAASKGAGFRLGGLDRNSKPGQDSSNSIEDDMISSMDGCRVIAGTTRGGIRVWSLKDVCSWSLSRRDAGSEHHATSPNQSRHGYTATNVTSSLVRSSADDIIAMQDSVHGFHVGGHRGGVTCIDIPPRMYRPDTLLSGGEDGLIKLWSLKNQSSQVPDKSGHIQDSSVQSRFFSSQKVTSVQGDIDSSVAQAVLTGHGGKILCIKTAWHGDKCLSGGADKTVRLWDISGNGGKPLTTLNGHQGWVTQTHFWGPHVIVSASTDRSVALWDTRAGSSPIFALRHHLAPVSDLLLGNRSEPLMVSAGADGSLATWDFRVLSGSKSESSSKIAAENVESSSSRTIRFPVAKMNHLAMVAKSQIGGPVKLSRAVGRNDFSFFSICDDGVVNEWDASTGRKLGAQKSGHSDAVSGFSSFSPSDELLQSKSEDRDVESHVGGTLSCSWDGTVRLRRYSRKSRR